MENTQKNKSTITSDMIAGLTAAIPGIPDALASGVLAGVSPINGLYSLMIGTPIAALFTGSAFISVQTTSAMCITIGSVLVNYPQDQKLPALVTVALVIGLFQILAGVLRLGVLVRFVSNAVMTGFLTGLGVLVILSQLGDLTGYFSEYSNKVAKAVDLLFHLNQVDVPTTIIGLSAIVLILVFDRTGLNKFSMLIGLIIVTLLTLFFKLETVTLVGDTTTIPSGLPRPVLPVPIFNPELISIGIAVGIIGLVQAAGISLGYPNPDGKYPDVSKDFTGQGIANMAMSLFQGVPVGGSLSSTALVVSAGARTRLANIFSGLFAIIAVLLFAPFIEKLPMAGLAAILIIAGAQSIKLPRIETVWQTGLAPRVIMIFTFIVTLMVPIQVAVFLGILLSFVMYVYRSSEKVDINEVVPLEGGRYEERPAPKQIPSNQITLLVPVGSLFFAGATEFEEDLPALENTEHAVVILRLRGREEVGSTFMRVIERYASNLKACGSKLMLVGISLPVYQQLQKTGLLDTLGSENVYKSTSVMGDSVLKAYQDATKWLNQEKPVINP